MRGATAPAVNGRVTTQLQAPLRASKYPSGRRTLAAPAAAPDAAAELLAAVADPAGAWAAVTSSVSAAAGPLTQQLSGLDDQLQTTLSSTLGSVPAQPHWGASLAQAAATWAAQAAGAAAEPAVAAASQAAGGALGALQQAVAASGLDPASAAAHLPSLPSSLSDAVAGLPGQLPADPEFDQAVQKLREATSLLTSLSSQAQEPLSFQLLPPDYTAAAEAAADAVMGAAATAYCAWNASGAPAAASAFSADAAAALSKVLPSQQIPAEAFPALAAALDAAGTGASEKLGASGLGAALASLAPVLSSGDVEALRAALMQLGDRAGALAASASGVSGLESALTTGGWMTWGGAYDLAGLVITWAGLMTLVAANARGYQAPAPSESVPAPDLGYEYDPATLEAYWACRPIAVAKRASQVATELAALGIALLGDMASPGGLKANEGARAVQLRGAIERLGPAYIKVAQALSTRVDLLSPAYFEQIQLLQDRVPPFPCVDAYAVMTAAWGGRAPLAVLSTISDKPVAAASLGQVYKATLRAEYGGGEVAVKVQRPGVLEQVSLDLLLIRRVCGMLRPQLTTDFVPVIDAWAVRFLHEMDYDREAGNAERFAADMAGLKGIAVPEPLRQLTTSEVLVTRWVEGGEKLAESTASDVRALCTTLLNAYLMQLLETGFLHADPHPGNLLRTPDGRVAILDYGLMTEVTEEQRWALVEYIAHLQIGDWVAVARDLKTLGFIPPEVDPAQAGLVEPLGRIMAQLTGGGGAAKVNIDRVVDDLNALSERYPFQVPPFFALILRAFSVIEGIALGVDPDYAIVLECMPYIARRLLSDDSPRARAVLRQLLYGDRERLDIERLMRVADGFAAFTTDGLTSQQKQQLGKSSTLTAALQAPPVTPATPVPASAVTAGNGMRSLTPSPTSSTASTRVPAFGTQLDTTSRATSTRRSSSSGTGTSSVPLTGRQGGPAGTSGGGAAAQPFADPVVREALRAVFGRRNTYVQELLVEEVVAAVDALSKEAVGQLLRAALGSGPALIAGRIESALLGPLRSGATSFMQAGNTGGMTGAGTAGLAGAFLLPTPLEVLQRLNTVTVSTPEDKEALAVLTGVLGLLARASNASSAAAAAAASGAGPLPAYRSPGVIEGGSTPPGPSSSPPRFVGAPAFSATSTSSSATSRATMSGSPGLVVAAPSASGAAALRSAADDLGTLLPELLPGLASTGEMLVRALVRRAATRVSGALSAVLTPVTAPAASSSSSSSISSSSSASSLAPASSPAAPQQPYSQQQSAAASRGTVTAGAPVTASRTLNKSSPSSSGPAMRPTGPPVDASPAGTTTVTVAPTSVTDVSRTTGGTTSTRQYTPQQSGARPVDVPRWGAPGSLESLLGGGSRFASTATSTWQPRNSSPKKGQQTPKPAADTKPKESAGTGIGSTASGPSSPPS